MRERFCIRFSKPAAGAAASLSRRGCLVSTRGRGRTQGRVGSPRLAWPRRAAQDVAGRNRNEGRDGGVELVATLERAHQAVEEEQAQAILAVELHLANPRGWFCACAEVRRSASAAWRSYCA